MDTYPLTCRQVDSLCRIRVNSGLIQPGDIFVALPGSAPYLGEARRRGAAEIRVMTRHELARWTQDYYHNPSQYLTVVGVTGTNGKTTVTHLVHHALLKLGFRSQILGTINASLTTPESPDLQYMMACHAASGGTHFVMEVSSHGIAQYRVTGVRFAVKLLTNITQDHLDYHGTFAEYRKTKMNFMNFPPKIGIFPEDYSDIAVNFSHRLCGDFNQKNLQSALAILQRLGISTQRAADILGKLDPPPGRFERICSEADYTVIVDYAHTPDGMTQVLETARKLISGKITVVFGCGGDRDRLKRPLMGEVAYRLADRVILTQDNSRTEAPSQIFSDIITGFPSDYVPEIIMSRAEAIRAAVHPLNAGDGVLILGKGHETKQVYATETIHFDDRESAKSAVMTHPRGFQ